MTAGRHSRDLTALCNHPLGCRLARPRASLARVIKSAPVEIVVRQSCTAWHRASGIARAATAVTTKL